MFLQFTKWKLCLCVHLTSVCICLWHTWLGKPIWVSYIYISYVCICKHAFLFNTYAKHLKWTKTVLLLCHLTYEPSFMWNCKIVKLSSWTLKHSSHCITCKRCRKLQPNIQYTSSAFVQCSFMVQYVITCSKLMYASLYDLLNIKG